MTDTIPRQPLATAPEGVKVQLVFRDKDGNMWRSPRPFVLNNGKWRSETTGLPLSGVDPVGWNRWTETQKGKP